MSLYRDTHRNAASDSNARLEYLLVYAACFAAYLVPVAIQRIHVRVGGEMQHRRSILTETRARAANCASLSFAGL